MPKILIKDAIYLDTDDIEEIDFYKTSGCSSRIYLKSGKLIQLICEQSNALLKYLKNLPKTLLTVLE